MAQLIIRGLEADAERRLRKRAARYGRSMEAEARDILRDALKRDGEPSTGLGSQISARFKTIVLKPHEEIVELRGTGIRSPFE